MIMPLAMISSVLPSGGACATASAAMMPPAPGLLSTMTVWPFALPIWSASRRTSKSMVPPAGTEMTTLMVRAVCADAVGSAKARLANPTIARVRSSRIVMLRC